MSLTIYQPNIDQVVRLVADSLNSPKTAMVYEAEIRQFLGWWEENMGVYLSPMSALDAYKQKIVGEVSRSTANKKLSAIRKLFLIMEREGMLSYEEVRKLEKVSNFPVKGQRIGHWLTYEEMLALRDAPNPETAKGIRDRAILAVMLGCGLRRFEVVSLNWGHIQKQGDTWVIFNLEGKHGRVRTVPVPPYTVERLNHYRELVNEVGTRADDPIFRNVTRYETWGNRLSDQAIYLIVKEYGRQIGRDDITAHDLRRSAAKLLKGKLGIEQTRDFLGHSSVTITERYLDTTLDFPAVAEAMNL